MSITSSWPTPPLPEGVFIRPARASDLPVCAAAWGFRWDTYTSTYPLHLRRSDISDADRIKRNQRDLAARFERIAQDEAASVVPAETFEVAVRHSQAASAGETVEEEILGYMIWSRPGAMDKESSHVNELAKGSVDLVNSGGENAKEDEDPECNHELSKQIGEETRQARLNYLDGANHWMLQQLFLLPTYQRRGIGSAMLAHGMSRIKRRTPEGQQVIIGMTSSPQGVELYRRFGFETVYWFKPQWMDWNENREMVTKTVAWPLLVRKGPL